MQGYDGVITSAPSSLSLSLTRLVLDPLVYT
jgi:hypothetical protein